MTPVVVTDWGTALSNSVAGALAIFLATIPGVIGFLLIVIIGWIISGIIATLVASLLRTVRFNDLAYRAGVSDFISKMGIRTDVAGFIANIIKWSVRLIVLIVAFDVLGLTRVSLVLQDFLLWIPNLIVAMVVLVIGGLLANAAFGVVRAASAKSESRNPDLLGNVARYAVWGFVIAVALNQIGIATALVNTLFAGLIGATALALGLAFGLGGRETAAEIVRGWYQDGKRAVPLLTENVAETNTRPVIEVERIPERQL